MGFLINTNVQSINSQRQLNRINSTMSRTFQRLSSGLRINSAADDAAGLGITDRMGAQIRGLNQAVRNANDGISLSQTAEAAMAEETNILLRMRELAIQSANDTNTTTDRASIQAEVEQLVAELDRIGNNSQFNGKNLLDGTFGSAIFHVGANANQTISVELFDSRSTALGATASTTSGVVTTDALTAGELTLNGTTVATSLAADDTLSSAFNSASAIAKATAINKSTGEHGVLASVDGTTVNGTAAVTSGDLAAGDLTINGVDIGAVAGVLANDADGTLVAAINAKAAATGVTAEVNAGVLELTAADGRNITIAGADSTTEAHLAAATTTGTITLTSDEDFVVAGTDVANAGLAAATYSVDYTNVVSTISMTTQSGANAAISIIDTAISQIASRRGDLGAIQNRLGSTMANLEAVSENLSAASSRIKDADFAAETAEMTRSQIIQQAAVSMLSQANQAPQAVLGLLR